MNLLEMMLSGQNQGQIQQLARSFGIGEDQAQAAVSQMVPALSQGVRRNIGSQEGLGSLLKALQTGGHQKYVDHPEALAERQATEDGNAILGHILGSKEVSRTLADRTNAATGLDSGMLKKMLPLVASMMMGSMSKQASGAGMPGGGAVSADSSSGLTGMLSGLLDADKDGSVVDDLLGMAGKLFR
jgi:hypothetical protein